MNQQEAEDIPQTAELSATRKQQADSNSNEIQVDAQEEVRKEEWEIQRDHHKSLADAAFRAADYITAIQEYTSAISLDPDLYVLYSNRSAAYLANGEKSKALADAKKCVLLKPDFVKGHNRVAASMMSLGRWNEARNVYRNVLNSLDEKNEVAKKGLDECRLGEQRKREAEQEMIRLAQEKKRETATMEKRCANEKGDYLKNSSSETAPSAIDSKNGEDDEDDLLNEFFDEVEDTSKSNDVESAKEDSEHDAPAENKIQIQLNDLGDTHTQIQRLLRPNHEWYNLNPFKVLDVCHEAPIDILSRRYKALSLLLHPDKVKNLSIESDGDGDIVEKAQEAFEYVRKAMNSLNDETKAKYFKDLVEQGMKQGKKDYENNNPNKSTLEQCQEKAIMKIFAEIERKRRDVERRKRNQEKREREQEDAEKDKLKKEHDFEKKWKDSGRVEKRIGNWRDFTKDKRSKY